MHIKAGTSPRLQIFDADGVELQGVKECNLETGWVLRVRRNAYDGSLMSLGGELMMEHVFLPYPLQAFTDTGVRVQTELELWVAERFDRLGRRITDGFEAEALRQKREFQRIQDELALAWAETSFALKYFNKPRPVRVDRYGHATEVGETFIPLSEVRGQITESAELAKAYGKYVLRRMAGGFHAPREIHYSEPHRVSEPYRV